MTSDNLDLHHLIERNSQLSNYLSGSAQIIDTSGIDWGKKHRLQKEKSELLANNVGLLPLL